MRLDLEARKYLGVPWVHQGRDPLIGFDCIGLPVRSGNDGGYAFVVYDTTQYSRTPAAGVLEGYLDAALGLWLPPPTMQPGDLAAIDYCGAIRHLGIIGEHPHGLSLIHTNQAVGHVTEARIDAKWARRIKRIYRPVHP